MAVGVAKKATSLALSGVLVFGGSTAIVGAQVAMPAMWGNTAYAKTLKGSDGELTYKSISSKSVKVYKCTAKKRKTVDIGGTVAFGDAFDKPYAVKGIASKAFKGTKVETVCIYTTKLTKKNVKNCFKGSKVETVKVPKKVLKKYKKYFKKSNCGKSVDVVKNSGYSSTVEKLPLVLD